MRTLKVCLLSTALALTSITTMPASAQTPNVAASIGYEIVAAPANLSDDFKPQNKTDLKFLAIRTIDGNQIAGALWQPKDKSAADTTVVIMIHGSGGSYLRAPQSPLGSRLAAKGYASLAINTRQHDDRINTENFFDIRRDIEAAVYTARALGYRKLVLQGHSLGNIQVQFYAATNWDSDIKAVMLLGAFGNLPWKTRNILVQNEDRFRQLIGSAQKAFREGKTDTTLDVKMSYYTGEDVPLTAQHFLTYRWDKTSVADGTQWIKRVPYPVLLVRDQADGVIQPFEPYMLLDAAHAEGSLVKSIELKILPNSKAPNLKGHSFDGNEQPLADTLASWLAAQGL